MLEDSCSITAEVRQSPLCETNFVALMADVYCFYRNAMLHGTTQAKLVHVIYHPVSEGVSTAIKCGSAGRTTVFSVRSARCGLCSRYDVIARGEVSETESNARANGRRGACRQGEHR